MRRRIGLVAFACAIPLLGQTARVPFVGCASDGQAGPVEALKDTSPLVKVDVSVARRLAYYKAFGFGVLAPRGWHCFGIYGSSGGDLFVAPQPMMWDDFSSGGRIFTGPIIQIESTSGGGSGSSEVARVIARVFPAYRWFPEGMINGGLGDGIVFGPYPNDKLTVQSRRLVEFETPANSEGLGTTYRVEASGDPIEGAAILQGTNPDLLMLTIRLPRELRDLAPIIIHQLERENLAK